MPALNLYNIMKGPVRPLGPILLSPNDAKILDEVLVSVITLVVIILVTLIYLARRKGPRLRGIMPWRTGFWNGVERLHNAYLSARAKRKKDDEGA